MTTVKTPDRRGRIAYSLKLRDRLFLSYSLLSVVVLLFAAWVIDSQVVDQARQQVQEEMKASLPLYDAVWNERAGRLSDLGMAMAGSPIVKAVLGDPRASRDRGTIRQMLGEFGQKLSGNVDLVLVTDGGGGIVFDESQDASLEGMTRFIPARTVAESQKPAQFFMLLKGRLLHLVLTPVTSHSSSEDFNTTLAVLVAGFELNRDMALNLRRRAHSDVLFFSGDRIYASSLEPAAEALAAKTIVAGEIGRIAPDDPAEVAIGGDSQLAFARPLSGYDGGRVGYVVVLHSLGAAARLFHAISNRLVLAGTISIVLVLVVSYFIARLVTQPIEALVVGAQELGQGNYDHQIGRIPRGEIGQLASAFEQMRQSIQRGQAALIKNERLATVGQMAGGIIHDLRSPLAAISTAADLFDSAELSPEQRRILTSSQLRAAQRMKEMLRELLDFSRGRYELSLERHALDLLLKSVIQDAITAETGAGIAVDSHIPEGIWVRVDGTRARRLFENLLINSVQAMPEGGTITIRAAANEARVRVYVADTGSGIPAQLRDRLFEPFVSQGKQSGTGLGLAIARSIAVAHGGSLTLISDSDQPAEFCVELPLDSGEQHG
jgi:signal transduction histidine kinase